MGLQQEYSQLGQPLLAFSGKLLLLLNFLFDSDSILITFQLVAAAGNYKEVAVGQKDAGPGKCKVFSKCNMDQPISAGGQIHFACLLVGAMDGESKLSQMYV